MFDTRLLNLLEDNDSERRKQAIKALARSKDREVLPYLEEVATFDKDDEVRDLAGKAEAYIRKHAPTVDNDDPFTSDPFAALGDMGVTPTHKRRIHDNDMYADTVSNESHAGGAMFDRANSNQVVRRGPNTMDPVEIGGLVVALIGGLMMVVTFVLFPWFESGESFLFAATSPSLLANGGELTGLEVFTEALNGELDMYMGYNNYNRALDNLYFLTGFVLLGGVTQLSAAGMLLGTQRRPPELFWSQMLVLGLVALASFGWSYFDLLPFDQRLDEFGLPSPSDFLGLGYWAGLFGTVLVTGVGVFGQFYLNSAK